MNHTKKKEICSHEGHTWKEYLDILFFIHTPHPHHLRGKGGLPGCYLEGSWGPTSSSQSTKKFVQPKDLKMRCCCSGPAVPGKSGTHRPCWEPAKLPPSDAQNHTVLDLNPGPALAGLAPVLFPRFYFVLVMALGHVHQR